MPVNKGLGKGLASLFGDTEKEYNDKYGITAEELKNSVLEVPLDKIYPNPNQPRKVFDPKALDELKSSIKQNGVITPIVLTKDKKGKYMIIAGERRFRASKLANLDSIPAVVREYNERQVKEISLIENLQREDLNPIEAANAMKQLMDDYNLTQEVLADRLGKSRSAVANTLRLLSLNEEVVKLVASDKLSAGHARALVTLPEEQQVKLASETVKKDFSVREVEKAVRDYFNPPDDIKRAKKIQNEMQMSLELKDLIQRMQRVFATKVSAIGNDNKGRIYIDYYSPDDLDRIFEIVDKAEKDKK